MKSKFSVVCLSLVAALLGAGCGSRAVDLCESVCECETCSEKELEECKISYGAEEDKAAAYDCSEQLTSYFECALSTSTCEDGDYDVSSDCSENLEAYTSCVDVASAY